MNTEKRILTLFLRLLNGEKLVKKDLIAEFGKNGSTIQRNIKTIEDVLEDTDMSLDRSERGVYKIKNAHTTKLTDIELFALAEMLFASKAFNRQELLAIVEKVIGMAKDPAMINRRLVDEKVEYIGNVPKDVSMLDRLTKINEAIENQQQIEFDYSRDQIDGHFKKVPVALYFTDIYFYMMTNNQLAEDYRGVNNLEKFRIKDMHHIKFGQATKNNSMMKKFYPGKFRNETHFPFFGRSITIDLRFHNDPIFVFDRFPYTQLLKKYPDGSVKLRLHVNDSYSTRMWLLGQSYQAEIVDHNNDGVKDYVIKNMIKTLGYYGYKVTKDSKKT